MKQSSVFKIVIIFSLFIAFITFAQRGRWRQQINDRQQTVEDMKKDLAELDKQLQQTADLLQNMQQLSDDERNAEREKMFRLRQQQQQLVESIKQHTENLVGQRALKSEHDEAIRRLVVLKDMAIEENAKQTAALLDVLIKHEEEAFQEKSIKFGYEESPAPNDVKQQKKRDKFLPGEVWPDNNGVHINAHGGGILYYKDVYYWFGEHKTAGPAGNRANVGVHCYSSTDLYNWHDEGIALQVSEDPDSDIVKGCVIERPKVIYNKKTEKFVMWFHLELKGQGYNAARTGVAQSDFVTGPFYFIRSLRPNAKQWPENLDPENYDGPTSIEGLEWYSEPWFEAMGKGVYVRRDFLGGQMSRDMTLFVDEDGTAYHIHAAEENLTLHISELSEDYLSFTGRYVTVLPGGHNEAPAIFKNNGKYYLLTSGCTGWTPNAARSAVAASIWGPWKSLGNPCFGINPQNFMGPELTFGGQSTFVLPVHGKKDAFIAMFDVWRPQNPIDGGYIWLPIQLTKDGFQVTWMDEWDLSLFAK